ncbi:hypothetical protein [Pedobacter terrae]|uniref:hypothetical protein n=1 Tax=Pedobacter terrae TaxID=405671 RepID=UPI002FF7519E
MRKLEIVNFNLNNMKNILMHVLIVTLFTSCGNKKIDWSLVNLPIPLDSISRDSEILTYSKDQSHQLEVYKSFNSNLLYFANTPLAGKVIAKNSIILYVSKEDRNIVAVTLLTEDEENTNALLNIITDKLGKTDYHYFYNGNEEATVTQKIWRRDNKYYTLKVDEPAYIFGQKTKTAAFTIFNDSGKSFLRWWFYDGGDFSGFYGQYLDEKNKPEHQQEEYSYDDFVKQMDREKINSGTTSHYYIR